MPNNTPYTRLGPLLALAGLLALPAAAQNTAPASSAPALAVAPTWNLAPIFDSDAAWERERLAFLSDLPKLSGLRGSLGRDALALQSALDQISAMSRRLQRLWVYASTQTSTDNRLQRNQERSGLMATLASQFRAATAWVTPEIQALGDDKVQAFLQRELGLQRHEVRLRDALRSARHTLAPETEAAIAAMSPVTQGAGRTRTLLVETDVAWPTLQVDGRSVRVDNVGYQDLREHPDRRVREQAFQAFWKTYGQFENTLGSLLAQRVQAGVVQARLRQYPSALAASLAPHQIPETVVRTLVAQTREGLPVLHRYFKLRQRLLGLPDLHYHDIYPAMVRSTRRYPLAESAELTLASVAPLGAPYQAMLRQALAAGTMHAPPASGKSSGAYATGVYGLTPYIFLNHRDTYASLTTFAHEWGHGMHTLLADRAQPFETSGYSLFVAEIAAITHEVLLADHMLKQARSRDERLFVLGESLERLRGAFFRQAMFAEFELQVHDAQQRGEALNGKRFTHTYCQLLRAYHGADRGVMTIDPLVCHEWAFIPHFHNPFYVYAYATATAAAHHFSARILSGQPGAREAYLAVLAAGSSRPPHELLKAAGLDLSSPAPYQSLLQQMGAIMDEIERLLG